MKLDSLIKDMQKTVISGLLLSALWLACSSTYIRAVQRREDMRSLLAYLLIKEAVIPFLQGHPTFVDSALDAEWGARRFWTDLKDNCPDVSSPACKPVGIPVPVPWDPTLHPRINIVPIRDQTCFAFPEAAENFVPFEAYCFCLPNTAMEEFVFHPPFSQPEPTMAAGKPPIATTCNFDNQTREPYFWDRMRWINAEGASVSHARDLHLTDAAISKLGFDYLSPEGSLHENIAGLPVPIFLIPLVLGTLGIAVSCMLVGTWAALVAATKTAPTEASSWVMLYVGTGITAFVTRIASHTLALAALTVPVLAFIAAAEGTLARDYKHPDWFLCFLSGSFALFIGVLAAVLRAQSRVRRTLRAGEVSTEKRRATP